MLDDCEEDYRSIVIYIEVAIPRNPKSVNRRRGSDRGKKVAM